MFDRILVQQSREAHISANVEITEKRAPTDESVRLLKEMEAAALSKLLAAMPLDLNGFRGTLHFFEDASSGAREAIVRFRPNERVYEVRVSIPFTAIDDLRAMAFRLSEAVQKSIAQTITAEVFNAHLKAHPPYRPSVAAYPENITCPKCGRTSYHPEDVRQRWCAACNAFHEDSKR